MRLQVPSNKLSICFEMLSNTCLRLDAKHVFVAIGIIVLFIFWYLYRIGSPTVVKTIAMGYNRFYRIWPAWPFIHPTWTIAIGSLIAFTAFLPMTNELIVNVTAVYATILLIDRALQNKVPLLKVTFQENPPQSLATDTDLIDNPDCQYVIKQKITIENFGDKRADNLSVKCRAISLTDSITREWKQVTFDGDSNTSIPKDSSREVEFIIDSFDEYTGQEYLIEIKAKPSVRQGNLAIRAFHHTIPRDPDTS
jgi:hypothetical protein